jgi:hypothetical protein
MKSRLDQIEARLQTLIESSALLLPWANRQTLLAHQLAEAMHESIITDENGSLMAPTRYTVYLNPENLPFWETHQEMIDTLVIALQEVAHEAGVRFKRLPVIDLQGNPLLSLEDIHIIASHEEDPVGSTASFPIVEDTGTKNRDPRPVNAFLILNGEQIFPLRLVVINIGRRLDNQLIIDDPRVSRNHCQLRAIHGHYIIFDLNSTGGTYVNGQRSNQYTLRPGDVISLAGYPVIYGEEEMPSTSSNTGGYTASTSTRPEQTS